MGKAAKEQHLRLRELSNEEKRKSQNRKRPRWVDCFSFDVPALFNGDRNEGWARRLKEKLIISWNL
jgi:hypothetical protein